MASWCLALWQSVDPPHTDIAYPCSARSRNAGYNSDQLLARALSPASVWIFPSGAAFFV